MFTRDAAGRTTSVAVPGVSGSESTSYTYDAAGRMLTTTFANGDVEMDSFDGTTADLDSVVHTTSASATIASYAYSHNADGRVTQETLADGSYYSYGYDNVGQLTSESLNSGGTGTLGALHGYSYSYTYDGAGNRATKYNGTSTDTYSYDSANKLTSVGTKSYSYDDAGNCTSVYNSATGDTVSMTYDARDSVTSAYDSASTFSDSFGFNSLAQRVSKTDNSGSYSYTRADDSVDSCVLADGAATYNYGANGNSLISENRGGASKYYHSDALGSTGALTNSSGTTTDTHVTDAFGMSITGSGSSPTPFGFVGQGGYQSDSDTGLMLCGHRYYDSSAGRFLSRDPAQAGYNWYTYCGNDPVDSMDPTGLGPKIPKSVLTVINLALLMLSLIGDGTYNNLIGIINTKIANGTVFYDPGLPSNEDMETTPEGILLIGPRLFGTEKSLDVIAAVAADLAHEAVHNDPTNPSQGPNPTYNNNPMRVVAPVPAEQNAYLTTINVINAIKSQSGGKINGPEMQKLLKIADGCEQNGGKYCGQ